MTDDGQDAALVRRASEGDRVALKVLLVQSYKPLHAYIAAKTPSTLARVVDAEDIIQEVHIDVFRRIGDLRTPHLRAFNRWIYTIAVNRLRNAIKRHRAARHGGRRIEAPHRKRSIEDSTVELFDVLAASGMTPSRSVARQEAIRAVQAAITDLPEQYRHAVQLVHIEGYSVREAANALGRTERAVHGLCRRGLRRLRDAFGSRSQYLSSTG